MEANENTQLHPYQVEEKPEKWDNWEKIVRKIWGKDYKIY